MRRIMLVVAAVSLIAAGAPAAFAGGGGCHQDASTRGSETTVVMSEFCFMPTITTIKPGQTVTWVNKDEAPHTVTGMPGTFDSDELLVDQKFTHTFTEPGTFAYYCFLHRRMAGAVVVAGDIAQTSLTGTTAGSGTGGGGTPARAPESSSAAIPLAGIGIPAALVAGFFVGRRERHGVARQVTATH